MSSETDQSIESVSPVREWRILCVDDEANILSALRRLFRPAGYLVSVANSGEEALQALTQESFDLVISDMRMPNMNGAQLLGQVYQRWPQTIRILLTGYADMDSTIDAINQGQIYRYVAKPWIDVELLSVVRQAFELRSLQLERARLEQLTAKQNEELRALNAELEQRVAARTEKLQKANKHARANYITAIKVFTNLIELREPTLAGHSRRVAELAKRIAISMQLDSSTIQNIFLAGLLHDIGKIGLPDRLLSKPLVEIAGKDLEDYRKHSEVGEKTLIPLEDLRPVASIVRSHHERYDGSGYPDGRFGLDIPIEARILAVANEYDGYVIGTLGHRPLSAEDARKLITDSSGRRYDPDVVEAFITVSNQPTAPGKHEQAISLVMLEPGMVLSRDIISPKGFLLLAADNTLTPRVIRQIQGYTAQEKLSGLMVYIHR